MLLGLSSQVRNILPNHDHIIHSCEGTPGLPLFHLMDSFIPANQWCPCPVQLVAFPEYYNNHPSILWSNQNTKVIQTHVYNHRYNAFLIFGSHVGWLFSTSAISIHALSGYTQWWWFVELVTILPLMSRRKWLFQNQYDPIDPISKIIPNVGIAATNANISIMSIPNSCFKHPWRSVLRNLATLHSETSRPSHGWWIPLLLPLFVPVQSITLGETNSCQHPSFF